MKIVSFPILMKYHTLFFLKIGKMMQNLPPAAVMIGALRVKQGPLKIMRHLFIGPILLTLTMLNRDIS